jgi:hypothetical protein
VPLAIVALALLILGFLCHRRRQRVRRTSGVRFDFSQAQEPPSVHTPTLPSVSVQSLGGWNDPPVAAFASAEPARDPFADPVLMLDEPIDAPRPTSYMRETRRVPTADPFADPAVVVFAPQGKGPSRLSKASSSGVRDARSSAVTFSNVRFSPFIRVR